MAKEVEVFWEKVKIPTRLIKHIIAKIEKLYGTWKQLLKNRNKDTKSVKRQRELFLASLDDLFDVAHANAVEMMNCEEELSSSSSKDNRVGKVVS